MNRFVGEEIKDESCQPTHTVSQTLQFGNFKKKVMAKDRDMESVVVRQYCIVLDPLRPMALVITCLKPLLQSLTAGDSSWGELLQDEMLSQSQSALYRLVQQQDVSCPWNVKLKGTVGSLHENLSQEQQDNLQGFFRRKR